MRIFIIFAVFTITIVAAPAIRAAKSLSERNSGFGDSLFSEQSPAALADPFSTDPSDLAEIEPVAGDEEKKEEQPSSASQDDQSPEPPSVSAP